MAIIFIHATRGQIRKSALISCKDHMIHELQEAVSSTGYDFAAPFATGGGKEEQE